MGAKHVITIHTLDEDRHYGQCSCAWGTNIFASPGDLGLLVLSHFEQVGYVTRLAGKA